MDSKLKKRLDDVFYGDDLMMKGFEAFRYRVKDVPQDKLKYYYDNQEVVQMFRPIIKRRLRKYIPITASAPFERVYFDTMYLTSQNLTFINAVDLFSRYGFSTVFRGQVVSSDKTTKFLEEVLMKVINMGYYISNIVTDDGSEFKAKYRNECGGLLIDLSYTDPKDKLQTSIIEAFNRTVRLSLEKFLAVISTDHPKMVQIEKGLNDMLKAYNNTKHSFTGYSPVEILKSKDIQTDVNLKAYLNKNDALEDYPKIPVGSWVRVALYDSSDRATVFNKLAPTYSKEIYKVKEYDSSRNRYVLDGIDGFWEYWKLQVIDKKNLMRHTIKRYIDTTKADEVRVPRSLAREKKALRDYTTASEKYAAQSKIGDKRGRKKKTDSDFIE